MVLESIKEIEVVVRGAGDLATGVIYNLYQAGFRVVATEIENPMVVRRTVSFAEAIYQGKYSVEDVTAQRIEDYTEVEAVWQQDHLPIIVDPKAEIIDELKPQVVVDATMAKRNLGTQIDDAPLVIALGPGFSAGDDVDAVIETNRGHDLGRIITSGRAEANTGVPGNIEGYTSQRVIRNSTAGIFTSPHKIGDRIKQGEVFGYVGDEVIKSKLTGRIRGLLKTETPVEPETKLGDVDPRDKTDHCYKISDKARAIGGAVVTAILSLGDQ
ncbi:MAG: selenium-dependent molybdenum cofactor biosynthesis protein YqeB [Bacillota bacterium]